MIKIYKTTILPVVLYECELVCLTLQEEYIEGVCKQGVKENIWN
jgi:hypothetical protein